MQEAYCARRILSVAFPGGGYPVLVLVGRTGWNGVGDGTGGILSWSSLGDGVGILSWFWPRGIWWGSVGVPCPGPIQKEWAGWGGHRVEVGWCGGGCGVGQGYPVLVLAGGSRPGWRCGWAGWGTLSWSRQVPSPSPSMDGQTK